MELKTKIKWSLLFLITFIAGTIGYVHQKLTLEDIIICSTDDSIHLVLKSSCRFTFDKLVTAGQVNEFNAGSGLSFAFNLSESNRFQVLDRLLNLGVGINRPSNIDGLTPLNAAILENDDKLVRYLLKHGANTEEKNALDGNNSSEFLTELIARNPEINREAIRNLISFDVK